MTTRPHLRTTSRQVVGVLSLALFVVLTAVFLTADFGTPEGLSGVKSVTAAIGYALFNLEADVVPPDTEGFLVAFEIVDVVLVAALTAAVMLARRQEGGRIVTALADGGRRAFERGDGGADTGDTDDPSDHDAAIDRETDTTSAAVGDAAEGGVAEGGVAEGGVAEGGVAEGGVAEGGVAEGGVAEGGVAEGGVAEGGVAEGGVAEGGVAEGGVAEGGGGEG